MEAATPQEIEMVLQDDRKLHEIAKAAFEIIDTDQSGYIDKYELREMMNSASSDMGLDPPSDLDVIDVIKELDFNGDGIISLKEFTQLIKEVLEEMVFTYQS